jgi:hypothetical protein
MGKRSSPDDHLAVLDRRQLLGGAAAVTAISGIPAGEPAMAAPQPAEAANLPASLRFTPATSRRLEEIALRNRFRNEAGLPLLSVVRELRRMKTVEDEERFNQFAALHRKAVWDEVLKPLRDAKGDPNWSPTAITGMGLQTNVFAILRQRYKQGVR